MSLPVVLHNNVNQKIIGWIDFTNFAAKLLVTTCEGAAVRLRMAFNMFAGYH
jgi:hypothetical protein